MPRPAITPPRMRCTQCGGHGLPAEYHPFAYCILYGQLGEEGARANLNAVLDYGRKLERVGLPNDAPIWAVREPEQDAEASVSPKGRKARSTPPQPRRRK